MVSFKFLNLFFSYKEPIFWQKISIFSYILHLNSLFFLSDFPKSGWDAWKWRIVVKNLKTLGIVTNSHSQKSHLMPLDEQVMREKILHKA